MEFELKAISPDSIEAAKEKAVRYRLLNQPALAESICRDVLAVVPDDREATITLLLSLTDQCTSPRGSRVREATELVQHLEGEYDKRYYSGMICERQGLAALAKAGPGSGPVAYDWLRPRHGPLRISRRSRTRRERRGPPALEHVRPRDHARSSSGPAAGRAPADDARVALPDRIGVPDREA